MTEMHDDLRELGRRLWPDDSALRPGGAARPRTARSITPRRLGALAMTMATAALMVGALTAAVVLHDRDQGSTSGLASSPHGRGTGQPTALHMVDRSAGWAWGPTLVTHTDDGVATLVDVTPAGIDSAHQVLAEEFLDSRHAWIVAGPVSRIGSLTLYRTADGGADWTATGIGLDASYSASLTFIDAQHGWLEGYRLGGDHLTMQIVLLRTTDGGAAWSAVYQTAQRITVEPNGPQGDCQWSGLLFSTAEVGFAGLGCNGEGAPQLDVTHDGGASWERMQLPRASASAAGTLMSTSVTPLTFVSAQDGVADVSECIGDGTSCFFHTVLYRTTDGGLSWTAGGEDVVTSGVVVAADLDHVWVPAVGALLATEDGGSTWTSLPLPDELLASHANEVSYQFVSPSVGYAVSVVGGVGPSETYFYRTTDGGRHFAAFTPTVEYAPAEELPRDGLAMARALSAAERTGRTLSSAPLSVESVAAGHLEEFAPQGPHSALAPTRWVWSVVLRGSFSMPLCGPLPVNGSPLTCPAFPPATSARVIVDYFTGAFLTASVPAPGGG